MRRALSQVMEGVTHIAALLSTCRQTLVKPHSSIINVNPHICIPLKVLPHKPKRYYDRSDGEYPSNKPANLSCKGFHFLAVVCHEAEHTSCAMYDAFRQIQREPRLPTHLGLSAFHARITEALSPEPSCRDISH